MSKYNTKPSGPNPDFTIHGQAIEYVNEWPHLGRIISVNCADERDIINRRNQMCGQINNVHVSSTNAIPLLRSGF